MSRSRYRFCEPDSPHFMICTIVAWLPVFATRRLANIIFESWQFLQNERSIDIIAYVLMENHLHWIATGPDLGKRVGEFGCAHAQDLFDQVVVKKRRGGYGTRRRKVSSEILSLQNKFKGVVARRCRIAESA